MYDKKDLLGNVHEGFTESRNGTMIYLLSLNFIFLKKKSIRVSIKLSNLISNISA